MSFFSKLIKIDKTEDFSNMAITGVTDDFFAVYLYNLLEQRKENILVVVNSLYEANKIYNSLSCYTDSTYLFSMDDFLMSQSFAASLDLQVTRLETIKKILETNKKTIVITNLMGYLRFLPSKDKFINSVIKLKINKDISREKLITNLTDIGYKHETTVTNTGEFAVRGYIVDIFPIDYDNPFRIEFFGDTIESIRVFDSITQKSIENKQELSIFPFWEFLSEQSVNTTNCEQKFLSTESNNIASIYNYLKPVTTVFKNYNQLKSANYILEKQIFDYHIEKDKNFKGKYMNTLDSIIPKKALYYMDINNLLEQKLSENRYNVLTIPDFNENIDSVNGFLKKSLKEEKIIIICLKKYQINSFTKNLKVPYFVTKEENISLFKINVIEKELECGFIYENYIVISEKELFKKYNVSKKYKTKYKYGSKISDLEKLQIGDYVVHSANGIGIYNGLKTIESNKTRKDYLEIIYQNNDKLYIPVEKIDVLSKYTGKEGSVPKISKLGGSDWQKTKDRTRQRVKDMAERLLKIYSLREKQKGYAFSKDSSLLKQFEDDFEFQLTKDQSLVIKQIKSDMKSIKPMDRLLCGDVGFGKTEVAFIAAFKAILDSKQVLFLCPTTILSNQHYQNAKERFKNFPVNMALLNRFTTLKEKQQIISELKSGKIDIVFGTHRLLSDDIKPNDLGLLIIDEEQRFGVTHKEKIKVYKNNVDVLTLTATPIPRTLQMSLSGIRSLSLIETPPVNRYPVQTYVIEESDNIIKNAIYKEMSRKGQVFLLFNRVQFIEQKLLEIQNLVPDAKIVCIHGQLSKETIEQRMSDFINCEYDILICTTIIETGIDIPNVNTLIIIDADKFGLSQLYQIRGRVGRSDRFAYAYLMYRKEKVLTENAVKRLNAIKEFTELGSGFSIATRDLSIRGAGDILGSEQAGFIDSVGIDLYMKMLKQEIESQRGTDEEPEEIENSNTSVINISTHIDSKYVKEDELKIEIHRMINTIDSQEKLLEVKNNLEDRFGQLNKDIIIYMYEEWFEKLINKIPVSKVVQTKNSIELSIEKKILEKVKIEELFVDAYEISHMFRFKSTSNYIIIILDTIKLEQNEIYYLIKMAEKILERLEREV